MSDQDLRCVTTRGLHELTGINMSTLRQWRADKRRPVSFRVGGVVLYRMSEVESWLAEAEQAEVSGRRSA